MNKIVGLFVLACFVALPALAQEKKAEGKTVTLHGYVVDVNCSKKMSKSGKVMEKAANHSKDCALSEACAASGYGIFSDGKYYKFDAAGSKEAKAKIEKSTKEKGLLFDVTGKMKGGTFAVASMKESEAAEKKAE